MGFRILTAGFFHETHTFLDERTRWSDFEVVRGAELFRKQGDGSPTAGFLESAEALGFEVIPTIDARATPSGMVANAAFEEFWREFSSRAVPSLAAGVDGIFLVLHGAMVTESIDDAEGEFLARLRALPGALSVPIFGVLDLHANVSAKMCALADGFTMYRENPHTDAKDAAMRATALLGRCLRERIVPHLEWCRPPIVWAPPGTGTASDPMRAMLHRARAIEAGCSEIWACNVAAGFSFADTPDTGVSLSAVVAGPRGTGHRALTEIAQLAWSLRAQGRVDYPPVDVVVSRLASEPLAVGPVLLVEPSDNIGGGAPGDGTGILRALLSHRVKHALVALNDPAAVSALAGAARGERRKISVGGRGWRGDAGPVALDVEFVSRSDGAFVLEDRCSHLASMSGGYFAMGPSAVVRHAGVTILLTSRKTPPFDLGQFRSQGIEPSAFAVIGVKAAVAHRRAYDPIARAEHFVETPGPCSSDLASFPWQRLKRPVWPLDSDTAFTPEIL